jgi:hypothetical protein
MLSIYPWPILLTSGLDAGNIASAVDTVAAEIAECEIGALM